jgi:hypothetical protein
MVAQVDRQLASSQPSHPALNERGGPIEEFVMKTRKVFPRTGSHAAEPRDGWRQLAALTLATGMLLGAAGCATTGAPPKVAMNPKLERYRPYLGAPVERIVSFKLDNWESVSRSQVILWTGINEAYLVSVRAPCMDLDNSERIAVTSTASSITRFEKIIVGRNGEQCWINEIRPIDVARMKADRKEDKAAAKS